VTKANEVAAVLRSVPGGADVATEQVAGQPILKIAVRQDEIAGYGIGEGRARHRGEAWRQGGRPDRWKASCGFRSWSGCRTDCAAARPRSPTFPWSRPGRRKRAPRRIASIETILGPKFVTREWSERRVVVQCNVRGRDVGGFVAEARNAIAEKVDLPAGTFRLEWGGQFENMQRAQKRLMIVVPLALLIIRAPPISTYRNVADMLLLFVSVPFACAGGICARLPGDAALDLRRRRLHHAFGSPVLSGMVVASAPPRATRRGTARDVAIEETATGSLRTIIMTALVASLGFIPMAIWRARARCSGRWPPW